TKSRRRITDSGRFSRRLSIYKDSAVLRRGAPCGIVTLSEVPHYTRSDQSRRRPPVVDPGDRHRLRRARATAGPRESVRSADRDAVDQQARPADEGIGRPARSASRAQEPPRPDRPARPLHARVTLVDIRRRRRNPERRTGGDERDRYGRQAAAIRRRRSGIRPGTFHDLLVPTVTSRAAGVGLNTVHG